MNVLLADDAKNRTPCVELIKAVEDTDTFGRHPWGNVVWNYLLGEVRKFVEKGGEPMEQGKKKGSSISPDSSSRFRFGGTSVFLS